MTLSVLLIDNSATFLPGLANYLMLLGCRVSVALTMRAGLSVALESQPNVIVMDVHLQDLDGAEAIRRLRGDSVLERVPIIALAAQEHNGDRQRYLDAGASAYVSKLVERESIAAIILAYARRGP